MIRWIAVLITLLLAGCVTTREVVYRDGYYGDRYADSRSYRGDQRYYDDGYDGARYYERDGSYYSPSYSGRGDYYYSQPDYYGYPSWYVDYPAYYSVFWGLNRTWYDPFWYPNYYYGVTYYPRNYFSISLSSGWGGRHYGYQYYSPYRYSWVDNYYDWSPWRHHHSRYYQPAPRYGSARNEAERLSHLSDFSRYSANPRHDGARSNRDARDTAYGRYGTARDGSRNADYGSRTAPRQDPGVRGFGVPTQDGYPRSDVRRNAAYGNQGAPRQDPGTRGFGVPVEGNMRNNAARDAGYGENKPRTLPPTRGFGVEDPNAYSRGTPAQSSYGREASYGAQREIGRVGGESVPGSGREYSSEREPRRRGYDSGVALPRANSGYERGYERADSAPVAREYSRPAMPSRGYDAGASENAGYRMPARERYAGPAPEPRGYSAPEPRGYSAPEPRGYSAPEPRGYSAPEPRAYSAPEPSYSAPEPSPRFESHSGSRSESRSDSDSDSGDRGVRRVGSNRDD